MADDFRQKAVKTANLLLEAASLLEVSKEKQGPSSSAPSRGSATTELRSLFNWNARGSGVKGKATKRKWSSGISKSAKKGKRGNTWTHTWVCLSSTGDESVPDSEERVTLKMAGIGERRFAVDSTATAQELCDELDSEYPKLSDAGGF